MPHPSSHSPILAAPGAGLPAHELWIARALFRFSRWRYTRDSANERFTREQQWIASLIERCGPAVACQRVLIPRLPGLEDSSRYWSVWMTLDHLRITNAAFSAIIRSLTTNITPPGVADTAAVKPSPDAGAAVVCEYEKTCSDVLSAVAENPNLKTPLSFSHPWFGALDAEGWHLLAGTHMRIHRKQIEAILKHLQTSQVDLDGHGASSQTHRG